MQLSPAVKDRSFQPSSRASQVSKERKPSQTPSRRSITFEYISTNYLEEWTQVYTDWFAIKTTRDGGEGVKYRAEEAHISMAAGRYATNFKAEAMALNTAATEILANLDKDPQENCFLLWCPLKPPKQRAK